MPPAEILYAENLALKSENGVLRDELAVLKWQIEKLRRQIFGPGRGEKLDRLQPLLKLQEVEIAPPQLTKREIVRPKYKTKADRAQPAR